MIKIAIVDDKRLNRLDRAKELEYNTEIKVIFTSQNGAEFLDKMKETPKSSHPEIVLMDIDMPEKNGIDTVRDAKVVYPDIEFLMLTVFDDDEKIFEAVKAGASGYLLKDESSDTIINFIKQVKEFRTVPMSPAIARKALKLLTRTEKTVVADAPKSDLTERELLVLKGLIDGYDHKEIADKLFVSPHTVRNQISSIYKKLHVNGKVDAVKIAIKNNLL
jgi:DNA-binding NarL/FixJ family response regulator